MQTALGLGLKAVKATKLVGLLDISDWADPRKYRLVHTSKESDWAANLRSRK